MDKEQIKKLKEELNDSFSDSYINNAGLLVHKLAEEFYKENKLEGNVYFNDNIFEYLYRCKGKFADTFLNGWFYNAAKDSKVLKNERKNKKTLPVEPIRNMVIHTMIENKVDPIAVSDITGLGLNSLEKIYREYKIDSGEEINKINLKLRNWA